MSTFDPRNLIAGQPLSTGDEEQPLPPDQVQGAMQRIIADPAMSRLLYLETVKSAAHDPGAKVLLDQLYASVLHDIILTKTDTDEQYALLIGRRLVQLMTAVGTVPRAEKLETRKRHRRGK